VRWTAPYPVAYATMANLHRLTIAKRAPTENYVKKIQEEKNND